MEQEIREGRGCGRERIPREEHEVVAEAPSRRRHERGQLPAAELAQEEIHREEREEVSERHLERPGLRERKEETDPGRRMEDSGLLDREQRLSGQLEPVPERKATILHGLARRLPPRDLLVDDVAQDRGPRLSDSHLPAVRRERVGLIRDVERRINAGSEHRLAGQEKRREREEDRNNRPDSRDEAIGEEEGERARREVDDEQPDDEQEQGGVRVLRAGGAERRRARRQRRPPPRFRTREGTTTAGSAVARSAVPRAARTRRRRG